MSIERQIAGRLIDDALSLGYSISVYDGGDWPLKASTDRRLIEAAIETTDSDTLRFRDATGRKIGDVTLVWGNAHDVISDCSDNPTIDALLTGAEALAETLQ